MLPLFLFQIFKNRGGFPVKLKIKKKLWPNDECEIVILKDNGEHDFKMMNVVRKQLSITSQELSQHACKWYSDWYGKPMWTITGIFYI